MGKCGALGFPQFHTVIGVLCHAPLFVTHGEVVANPGSREIQPTIVNPPRRSGASASAPIADLPAKWQDEAVRAALGIPEGVQDEIATSLLDQAFDDPAFLEAILPDTVLHPERETRQDCSFLPALLLDHSALAATQQPPMRDADQNSGPSAFSTIVETRVERDDAHHMDG